MDIVDDKRFIVRVQNINREQAQTFDPSDLQKLLLKPYKAEEVDFDYLFQEKNAGKEFSTETSLNPLEFKTILVTFN